MKADYALSTGHALDLLKTIPSGTVQCVITSPPYFGLRAYGYPQVWDGEVGCPHAWEVTTREGITGGTASLKVQIKGAENYSIVLDQEQAECKWCGAWRGELGQEPDPCMYILHLVSIFREVKRVLRDDGTLWVVIGDSYAGSGRGPTGHNGLQNAARRQGFVDPGAQTWAEQGIKAKDLIGIPHLLSFRLRTDGWYWRMDDIWAKPNPMPGSQRDRTTRAHESILMFAKSPTYFYDFKAAQEPAVTGGMRTRRSVWTCPSAQYEGPHFAVFPERLIEPMILAGSKPQSLVLDPFMGAGTVGVVAVKHARRFLGIDANDEYTQVASRRIEAESKGPIVDSEAEK